MKDFIHLHTHSDFSLLDGASSIEALVVKAGQCGMSHLALTDHGNMFGTLRFYKECRAQEIIPIVGSEFYVAHESRLKKTGGEREARTSHLILLSMNETGYRNLMRLVSAGFLEGFYYRPRIDKDILAQYSDGLICMSACLKGEIPHLINTGRIEEAGRVIDQFRQIFG